MPNQYKRCVRCSQSKCFSTFGECKSNKDGLKYHCKLCEKEFRDSDECKEYQKNYRKENREKNLRYFRNKYTQKTFGITIEKYEEIRETFLIEQSNKCAICGKDDSHYEKGLVLDHNHETGEVRGLLCLVCNTRLAYIENIEFVTNARQYLALHEE